jgi:hypothetical protein
MKIRIAEKCRQPNAGAGFRDLKKKLIHKAMYFKP